MKKETKAQRFKRVAEKRVQNILKSINSLSQCANTNIYAWDSKQLERIWKAMEKEFSACRQSFEDPDARVFKL